MRAGRTLTRRRRGGDGGTQWMSFSDLMSSLLLIFILIMFYIMYQYFDMYEINMAEIARQQYDLDQANASLESERTKLSEAESARLSAVANLAPGDFRTVRQSLYYLGSNVDNAMRIGELEKESGVKSATKRHRIGF